MNKSLGIMENAENLSHMTEHLLSTKLGHNSRFWNGKYKWQTQFLRFY